VSGHDYESLLVNWLGEVLYLFDSAHFAAREFAVEEITPEMLRARLVGDPRDPARHPWKVIVKAITYHGIEVAERNGRWEARVFVDV
jgi:SHS2 domain-containing protein